MASCKARDIMKNEADFLVRRRSAPQKMGMFQQPVKFPKRSQCIRRARVYPLPACQRYS